MSRVVGTIQRRVAKGFSHDEILWISKGVVGHTSSNTEKKIQYRLYKKQSSDSIKSLKKLKGGPQYCENSELRAKKHLYLE